MRISDWSSDVCSSDLIAVADSPALMFARILAERAESAERLGEFGDEIGAVGRAALLRNPAHLGIADDLDRAAVTREVDDHVRPLAFGKREAHQDRKGTRLNSGH